MPTDIRVIHARDFLRATPEGVFDFEDSKQCLLSIATAASQPGDIEILLDTRKAHLHVTVSELWFLAAELSKLRAAFSRKTAVLCPGESFDNAKFFTLCSENRGFRMRAFTSFEDAILWLSEVDPQT
ncbi:MAG: hypothetical protein HY962_08320 [Ignavibacteriae bacterium]|nr:hypothetical protein [Ignavibacteriota bacterium]